MNQVADRLEQAEDYGDFLIVKPLVLSNELRGKMYRDLVHLVSQYAELSERYFLHSDNPVRQLLICDYDKNTVVENYDIINVSTLA